MSVEISHDLAVAGVGEYLIKTNAAATGTGVALGAKPTVPVEKGTGTGEIALWGDDNLFPTTVRQDAEDNTSLATSLTWRADAWYGGGLVYGLVTLDENGEEVFKRTQIDEVDAFLERSSDYAYEVLMDISYFANAFPELILTKDRSKVWSICTQDAEYCRFSKPEKDGTVKTVYINANFPKGGKASDEGVEQVAVIDRYFETADIVKKFRKEFKYIYPISKPSPGKSIYQLATWNTVRRSGWLEVAKSIPKFKQKLFENQLSIKYVVEVHKLYWEWKYGDWETKPKEERAQIIRAELDSFNKVMTGNDGAGKSILTTTIQNPMNPNEHITAFKVTAIDDKLKSGAYIEDSQEAASHVYTAVGVAPTLMGVSPGKGMGAGSGSDARVAFNNFISTSKYVQDLVVKPLHFIRDYNGWPANLRFRYNQPLIMTLDKGKQTQQETA